MLMPFEKAEYLERLKKVKKSMADKGIDVLLITDWTIVNKVDTIYKEKCRVQLLSAVPSTILLFHLVSSFRENYAVSWHYRILRCIRIQITGVPAENDMFYG